MDKNVVENSDQRGWPAHLLAFGNFLREFNNESDRGLVLVAASQIGELLSQCISAFLVKGSGVRRLLEGPNAPLAALSSKVQMCQSLGLISSREAAECSRIRRIRNIFAHQVHCSFGDASVERRCDELDYRAMDYEKDEGVNVVLDARAKFSTAAVCLILNLTNRATFVERQRLQQLDWPY